MGWKSEARKALEVDPELSATFSCLFLRQTSTIFAPKILGSGNVQIFNSRAKIIQNQHLFCQDLGRPANLRNKIAAKRREV